MTTGLSDIQRLATLGIIGGSGSGVAVIMYSLQNINYTIAIVAGLLNITIAGIALFKIIKHKDK